MVKAASEGFGLKAMAMDYNKPLSPWMFVDATLERLSGNAQARLQT